MILQEHDNLHIEELRKEYRRIDNDWLLLHYKITIAFVVFSLLIECAVSAFSINAKVLTMPVPRYLLQYVVIPVGLNVLIVLAEFFIIRSRHISQKNKSCVVSLAFTLICFILYALHNAFVSTYYIFILAMILTVFYADYLLTGVTALTGLVLLVVTEVFIRRDLDSLTVFNSSHRLVDFLIALFILIGCVVVCMVTIRYELRKNEAGIHKEIEHEMLRHRLRTDELTGVFSRKSLHDALQDIEEETSERSVILAIADIDHFKSVNDIYGHHTGDQYLVEFANLLVRHVGASSVYRYGGDEFCLLFFDIEMQSAVEICTRIQQSMCSPLVEEFPELKQTASIGLSEYTKRDNTARLFIHADQALYEAKEIRNTVRVYHPKSRRTD